MPVSFRREKPPRVLSQNRKQGNGYRVEEEQTPVLGQSLMSVDEGKSPEQVPQPQLQIRTSVTTPAFHGSCAGPRLGRALPLAIRLPRSTSIAVWRRAH